MLTPKGQQQAQDVAKKLGDNNYDAIYASTMVRTQLTAAPMSQYLGLPIQVLPGLQEIEAGDYEGTSDQVNSSGQKLSDSVKKVTDRAGKAGKVAKTGADDSSTAKAGGEKDAA